MKKAKLFRNGGSQAVRLPKEFQFEGKEVFIKKIGNVTVLLPVDQPWVNSYLKALSEINFLNEIMVILYLYYLIVVETF